DPAAVPAARRLARRRGADALGASRVFGPPRVRACRGRLCRDPAGRLRSPASLERAAAGQWGERSAAVRAVPPGHRGVESPACGHLHELGAALRLARVGSWHMDDHGSPQAGRARLRLCRRWTAVGPRSLCAADWRRVRWNQQPSCAAVSIYAHAVTNGAIIAALMVILVALSPATEAQG